MNITIVGTGYVGLVTGACLSEMGNDVLCLDTDSAKVDALQRGVIPIHERGLEPLVRRNLAAGRLQFTTDVDAAVAHGELQFICVGTPPLEDGSADLEYVLAAAQSIGQRMTEHKVVVVKSTVPVGTTQRVQSVLQQALQQRGCAPIGFSVASNPEFLKEGAAVDDFMRPDRIVIGSADSAAIALLSTVYAPFTRNRDRLQLMDVASAELTKYAANSMLATRISFMNELARLAESVGADIEMVRRGIGSDPRIGTHFLYSGVGFGGSCFPKDLKALIRTGQDNGVPMPLLGAVQSVNDAQKQVLVAKVLQRLGNDLSGRAFAVWGLAFKPDTDDMREAPSVTIIQALVAHGARLQLYDPVASVQAQQVLRGVPSLSFAAHQNLALEGADALLIVTDWREFKSPDFDLIRDRLKLPLVFDGRNLFDPAAMAALGIEYHAIGRGMPMSVGAAAQVNP